MEGHKVLVVGSGIIGLTVAKLLREKLDVGVVLYSATTPLATTSCGAGGLWMPFHCEPVALVDKWAEETLVGFLFDHEFRLCFTKKVYRNT